MMKNFLFFPHFQLNGLVVHTTHFMHSSKKRAYRKQVGEKVRVGSREARVDDDDNVHGKRGEG